LTGHVNGKWEIKYYMNEGNIWSGLDVMPPTTYNQNQSFGILAGKGHILCSIGVPQGWGGRG